MIHLSRSLKPYITGHLEGPGKSIFH